MTVDAHIPSSRTPPRLYVPAVVMLVLGIGIGALLAGDWGSSSSPGTTQGSGVAAQETRTLPMFTAIDLAGAGKVDVRIGREQMVVVTADDNIVERVTTDVRDGRLVIANDGSFTTKIPLSVAVTVPGLERASLTGSGSVDVEGIRAEAFVLRLPGSGMIRVSGVVDQLDAGLAGSGDAELANLIAREVTASVSGSGRMHVYAAEELDASVSGTGVIEYGGSPGRVAQSVSGTGAVVRR